MDRAYLTHFTVFSAGTLIIALFLIFGEKPFFSSAWIPSAALFVGALMIYRAGEDFVEGSITISKRLGLSQTTVGFTLVAIATSIPEILVSPMASHLGSPSISVGNVLGANIADLTLVLGTSSALGGWMLVERRSIWDAGLFVLISSILFLFLVNGVLSGPEAGILMILYALYLILTTRKGGAVPEAGKAPWWFFITSFVALYAASRILVSSVRGLSYLTGLSQLSLAATLVSLMTTLPELVTNVIAVRKGVSGLALGNAVGSGIANSCLGLPLAAAFGRVVWQPSIPLLSFHLALGALILLLSIMKGYGRKVGFALLATYATFVAVVYAL